MICRVWHGWTSLQNADAYDGYLQKELFPKVERELASKGYLGFQLLRLKNAAEVEFVTMLWFKSIESVKGFAGENYSVAVISDKAKSLLLRFDGGVQHYELGGSSWPIFQ